MDLYCSDKKLSELGGGTLGDLLDSEIFTPPASGPVNMEQFGLDNSGVMDSDWLDNFFDDPVLNDRMISDALQSEHSYSLNNNEQTLDLSKATTDKEMDMDLTAVNPNNMTLTTTGLLTTAVAPQAAHTNSYKSQLSPVTPSITQAGLDSMVKQEPLDLTLDTEMTTVTVTRSTNPQTLLKQPTIILATQPNLASTIKQERLVLPKVNIKMEPQHHSYSTHSVTSSSPEHLSDCYDALSLPPTPPSSHNSDSDGGASPNRSPPSSPHRSSSLRHRPLSPQLQQPFFMSPIPTSGVLVLTEEEKRTLISEGYPIPAKLPLTKQEEKNLKKIRRKIKNKISAQESRRKKKEYLETLERKVESYSQENGDLRKKCDNLQNNNQSLLSQLQKLQQIVRGLRPTSPTSTGTGTCLMVLVMCFAVFLGSWSPSSLSIGYSSVSSVPNVAPRHPISGLGVAPQQPEVKDPGIGSYNAYSTPNMKSRLLLSVKEDDEEFGPVAPFSYKEMFGSWFSCLANQKPASVSLTEGILEPLMPLVNILDKETEINQTGEGAKGPARDSSNVAPPTGEQPQQQQASMHPDITVTTTATKRINATA